MTTPSSSQGLTKSVASLNLLSLSSDATPHQPNRPATPVRPLPDLSSSDFGVQDVEEQLKTQLLPTDNIKIFKENNSILDLYLPKLPTLSMKQLQKLSFKELWCTEEGLRANIQVLVEKKWLPEDHRWVFAGNTLIPEQDERTGARTSLRRKPDAAILLPAGTKSEDLLPRSRSMGDVWTDEKASSKLWSHIGVPIEVKYRYKTDPVTKKPVMVETLPYSVFQEQMWDRLARTNRQRGRMFSLALSIGNKTANLWYGSASGIIISHSISTSSPTFLQLLIHLSSLNLDDLGLAFCAPYGYPSTVSFNSSLYRPLPSAPSPTTSSPSTPFAQGVPDLLSSPTQSPSPPSMTLLSTLFRRTRFTGRGTACYEVDIVQGKSKLRRVLKTSAVDSVSVTVEAVILSEIRSHPHPSLLRSEGSWQSAAQLPGLEGEEELGQRWTTRYFVLHLVEPVQLLWNLPSRGLIGSLKRAVRGIVAGLAHLLSLGWIHRDVSIGNVFFRVDGGSVIGILGDFDMAAKVGSYGKQRKSRTGTLPFLSRKLLDHPEGADQDEYDDLESLYFVVVWFMLHNGSPATPLSPGAAKLVNSLNDEGIVHVLVKRSFASPATLTTLFSRQVLDARFDELQPFLTEFSRWIFGESMGKHDELLSKLNV